MNFKNYIGYQLILGKMTLVVFHLHILSIFSLTHTSCAHISLSFPPCPSWQMFGESSESDIVLSLGGVGVVSVMSLIENREREKNGIHHFLFIVSPVTPRPPHDRMSEIMSVWVCVQVLLYF